MMSVGQTIRFYRKEQGLTQSELAEMINVSTQAVSKWETDWGMPDISMIVPLAKVLNISTDKLLGLTSDEAEEEITCIREKIGHHTVSFSSDEAQRIYDLSIPLFAKHPTNPEIAFWCLESLSVLITAKRTNAEKQTILKECKRYENCISRYETNPDAVFKSYYIASRCYTFLGEKERAEQIKEKLPHTFGDRTYWEAEFAYADGDMELALKKCKESFAEKARFIARCIRLCRNISIATEGEAGIEKQLALNEYMLHILDAFLSGGDYLPYRMIYQKTLLLYGMVKQYADLEMTDKALFCMQQLLETRTVYLAFLKDSENKHCLTFPETDCIENQYVSPETINTYVTDCFDRLSQLPSLQGNSILQEIRNQM